jgi:hypothetical protein
MKNPAELTRKELRFLRSLKSPYGIQHYLDSIPYHHAGTAWSPRRVIKEGTAHCLEGAVFAAAALKAIGYPPLVWDLEAYRDSDHVLAVFQVGKHWGSIAKSNFTGLRYREPVYQSLRELAMSYFDDYFNLSGDRSLRAFATKPVNLSRFDRLNWMTTDGDVWFVAEHLVDVPHTKLLTSAQVKMLVRVGHRRLKSGMVGMEHAPNK